MAQGQADLDSFYVQQRQRALAASELAVKEREDIIQSYEALIATLDEVPKKVNHNVMVPVGTKAFFQGRLEHTNELTVLVGDNYFLKRTAPQAVGIAERRIQSLRTELEQLHHELEGLGLRTSLMPQPSAAGGEDVLEIFEPLPEGMDPKDLLATGDEKGAGNPHANDDKGDTDDNEDTDPDDTEVNYGYGFDRAQFDPAFAKLAASTNDSAGSASEAASSAPVDDARAAGAGTTPSPASDPVQQANLDKKDKQAALLAQLAALELAEAEEDSDDNDDEYDERSRQQRMIDQLASLHVPATKPSATVKVAVQSSPTRSTPKQPARKAASTTPLTMTPADIARMATFDRANDSHHEPASAARRVRFNSELEQGPTGGSQIQAPPILKAAAQSPLPAVGVVERTVVERMPRSQGGPQPPSAKSQGGRQPPSAPMVHGAVVERSGRAPTEQQLETTMIQRELLAAEAQSWLGLQQRAVAEEGEMAQRELAHQQPLVSDIPTIRTGVIGTRRKNPSKPAKKTKSLFMQQMGGSS